MQQLTGMHSGFWCKNQKDRDHKEDIEMGQKITLNWILEKYNGLLWIGLIWLSIGTHGGWGSCEHGNAPSSSQKCWEIL
jgi:hypothetical protein